MSACFDFFSEVVPAISIERFCELCDAAWKEEPKLALSLFVWLGSRPQYDLREEKSEEVRADHQNFFRAMIWLFSKSPSTLLANLEQISLLASHVSLLDVLMFIKVKAGTPESLECISPSGDDWRKTATPEKLQEEFDCFRRLDTFRHLQVSDNADADASEEKLFDAIVNMFVHGLQEELARVRSDKWYKRPFAFGVAAPQKGGIHDLHTNVVDVIIERLFGSASGEEGMASMRSKYQQGLIELQKAENARQKYQTTLAMAVLPAPPSTLYQNQKIERQFKRALHRAMGVPVKDQRESMRQFFIVRRGIEQANQHLARAASPSGLIRCEFSPNNSVTIGKRKLPSWKACKISIDADAVEAWEDKLQLGQKAGARKGGAKRGSAAGRLVLEKSRKGVPKRRQDSEIQGVSAGAEASPNSSSAASPPSSGPATPSAREGKAEMEAKLREWMEAVTAECAKIAADEEAMRIIEEVQRAEWQRCAESETARLDQELQAAEQEAAESLKAEWVREVEQQYEEVEDDAEAFLARIEQQRGEVMAGVDEDIQGEWVRQIQRQYSRSQLEEIEDEDEAVGEEEREDEAVKLQREFSQSHLTAIRDEGAQTTAQTRFGLMAKQLVRETSNCFADDEDEGAEEEAMADDTRYKMVVELPVAVVVAQLAAQGREWESSLAELLAVQDLDEEDEEAMEAVDAALQEEWVNKVACEASEVQDAGDAFVQSAPSEGF